MTTISNSPGIKVDRGPAYDVRARAIILACADAATQNQVVGELRPQLVYLLTLLQGGVGAKSTLTAFQRGSDKVGPECRQSARRRPKRPGAAPATRCAPPLRRQKLPVPRAAPKTGRQTAAAAAHGRPNGARAAAAAR